MPRHHRRILFSSYDDDDHGPCWSGCASPPSPPPYTQPPTPAPAPSTHWFPIHPHIPEYAPAPSPARHPAAGRRNQGGTTNGYAQPPPAIPAATDAHHRRFVTNVLAASAALVFLSLILLGVSVAVRRRNLRRRQRRQALLAPAPAATLTNLGNDDPDNGGAGGVVHHVWYIRTVGLDQAAIDSIAATRYRAGLLAAAADCSVCLGEFGDGELVRLLPRCAHAFHVPCIDTWLRAHVNCPLCRSDVIDPAAAAAADSGIDSSSIRAPADPDADAVAAAEQVAAVAIDDSTPEHQDQEAPHVEEEDRHEERDPSSPEPLPQLPCPLPRNVRRAASMDAATVSAAAEAAALDRLPEAAPEGEQSDHRPKDRTDNEIFFSRFFFSRHCRARSSVLPLTLPS